MRAPKEPEYRGEEERPPFTTPGERPERAGRMEPVERVEPMGRFEPRERYGLAEAPAVMSRDLSRWGPIFAGFVAAISTIVLLSTLGAAVGLTTAGPIGTAGGIWAAIVWLVGLFLGGWLAARLSAVGGRQLGLVQGTLVWAFTIFFALIITALGASALLGSVLGGVILTVAGQPIGDPTTVWLIFGALLIGLIAAALGGWVGARSTDEAPAR
ncbi:MAG: hypothetical protein ACUVX1_00645 [Chloroflexota bacterium]